MTVNTAMERAGGQTPGSPEPSFLVTLGDPQVTLLSVHKRWSFRRSPRATGSTRPVISAEERSPPSEKGEFSQKVLTRTQEVSSKQVSAVGEGLKSQEGF